MGATDRTGYSDHCISIRIIALVIESFIFFYPYLPIGLEYVYVKKQEEGEGTSMAGEVQVRGE